LEGGVKGVKFTEKQTEALVEIVAAWIGEGFTIPPYTDAQYDIFEALGLDDNRIYDTRRPRPLSRHSPWLRRS
jgi:hypothetical protein